MENINTQKNEKEARSTKQKTFFILRIIGNILFYLVIIALLLFSIMNINAGSRNGGFPNLFGKGFLSVQTNSMQRDEGLMDRSPAEWADYEIGGFAAGDLIFVDTFNAEKDIDKLKVGDVITYFDSELNSGLGALNTHRIVYISDDKTTIITQGDARAQLQPFRKDNPFEGDNATYNYGLESSGAVENVESTNIKGVVTSVVAGGGKVIDNIQQNWLWYFVLPVLLFLLFEIFMVVRNIIELKGSKHKAVSETDLEAQKELMRQQLLEELKAQGLISQEENKETEKSTEVEIPVQENSVVAAPIIIKETPIVVETTNEEVQEETVEEPSTEVELQETEEVQSVDLAQEENTEPVVEETPVQEEVQPVEETVSPVQEEVTEPVVEETSVQEEVQPVVVEVSPKKPAGRPKGSTSSTAKKTTSTTAKKATSTTKKPAASTSKSTTAKKASTSTAKKPAASASKSTTAKKATTTKKTTTGAKKTPSKTTKEEA